MYAAYRLMGNFPARGFGPPLSSAEFTSGVSIVSDERARLPLDGMPFAREPQTPGEVAEAYHAYEVHPLAFGQLTVMYSATGVMMQANGKPTRPCTYTNAVTWAGADVPAYVSDDAAMCSMLRYNDFVTLQEFWGLPKNTSILPTKNWKEDAAIRLEYRLPAQVSQAMHRSLLAHYWRAATLQFFGPWDSGKHSSCTYQDDLLLQHISNRDRNFTVCISNDEDCQRVVPLAKGFLWQMVLRYLPPQVRNITSMAAGIALQHARSQYRDAAMCVVYPSPEVQFDFTRGKFPALLAEEDQFMQQLLQGNPGNLLTKMHVRYAACTNRMRTDECTFMADYDLAMALFRLERATDVWSLLTLWYEVQRHLVQRHGLQEDQIPLVMQDVDAFVSGKLKTREVEAAQLLANQKDRAGMLTAQRLQSFLWETAVHAIGHGGEAAANIVRICQDGNGVFFTELAAVQTIPANEQSARQMANLVLAVLRDRYIAVKLTNHQLQQLLHITPVYHRHPAMAEAMGVYLKEYQTRHPEDRIRLLQLSAQYLDPDVQAAEAFNMLAGRLETPITEDESRAIGSVWQQLKNAKNVQGALSEYIAALYVRYFDDLSMVTHIATMMRVDTAGALVSVFTQEPACTLRLHDQNIAYVLGQNATSACLLNLAQNLTEVEQAYRSYLIRQLQWSVLNGESLYGWIVMMINRSLPTRLYVRAQERDSFLSWCTRLVHEYTLDYARNLKRLPAEDAFDRMLKLAAQGDPAFADNNDRTVEAYEALLLAGAPDAEQQAQQLAPYLRNIPGGSRMQQVTGRYICVLLQRELQKDRFWQVMNRKDIVQNIQRTGAVPSQLFDDETKNVAVRAIRRELAGITQADQYRTLWEAYSSEEGRFMRNFVACQGDQTIRALWRPVFHLAFLEQFEGFYQNCQSIDAVKNLMNVADHINISQKVNESALGRTISCLRNMQTFVHNLPDEYNLFRLVTERANALRSTQSDKAIGLVRQECTAPMEQEHNFMRRVALSLVRSIVLNGYNWRSFLLHLVPKMDDMVHNPYATESLPLLATVSSILRLFERSQTMDDLLNSFVHFLQRDANMAEYTENVCKDQKAMTLYFPGLENSVSLRAWLQG